MKWLGEGDSEMLSQSNGPQQVQQQVPSQVNAEASRPQALSRSQDDAMVGYVFQRPQADPDFPVPPTFKQQSRWPVTDDTVIDHNQEKWKYPVAKMPMTVNNVPFEVHPLVMKPGSEHFLYHHMTQPPPPMAGVLPPDMNPRNGQVLKPRHKQSKSFLLEESHIQHHSKQQGLPFVFERINGVATLKPITI